LPTRAFLTVLSPVPVRVMVAAFDSGPAVADSFETVGRAGAADAGVGRVSVPMRTRRGSRSVVQRRMAGTPQGIGGPIDITAKADFVAFSPVSPVSPVS